MDRIDKTLRGALADDAKQLAPEMTNLGVDLVRVPCAR